jgi:transposase
MTSPLSLPVVGIDVSKATLAVCYQPTDQQVKHLEVSNSRAGFQQLVQASGAQCWFVLEATGTYNLALAYYLHEYGRQLAVLNPLVIKRFIQMHLRKGKSDRKDAQWLVR